MDKLFQLVSFCYETHSGVTALTAAGCEGISQYQWYCFEVVAKHRLSFKYFAVHALFFFFFTLKIMSWDVMSFHMTMTSFIEKEMF